MSKQEEFLEFKADLALRTGEVIDLTKYIMGREYGGIGTIRSVLNPLRREIELSLAAILVDNAGGEFSPLHAARLWGANFYHGATARLFARWKRGPRSADPVVVDWTQVFGGKVERVEGSAEVPRAEFKVIDAFSQLRSRGVPDSLYDELQADDTPAAIALKLLGEGYANIGEDFIDFDSFADADADESGAGVIMKKFRLPSAPWASVIETVLDHGGASLAVGGDGKLSYFVWEPAQGTLPDPSLTLRAETNLISLRWKSGWQDIRNSIRTFKGNAADPPVTSATSGSPRQVDTSITEWDELAAEDLILPYLDADAAVELQGDRIVELQSDPPLFLEATCHLESDLWPTAHLVRAEVYDEKLGFNGETFSVIGIEVDGQGHTVTFTLWDNQADTEDWLIVNRSGHKLDDVYKVW